MTILFLCMIYQFCMDPEVSSTQGIDQLIEMDQIQDVGLIKDDRNPVFHRRTQRPEVRLLEFFEGSTAE